MKPNLGYFWRKKPTVFEYISSRKLILEPDFLLQKTLNRSGRTFTSCANFPLDRQAVCTNLGGWTQTDKNIARTLSFFGWASEPFQKTGCEKQHKASQTWCLVTLVLVLSGLAHDARHPTLDNGSSTSQIAKLLTDLDPNSLQPRPTYVRLFQISAQGACAQVPLTLRRNWRVWPFKDSNYVQVQQIWESRKLFVLPIQSVTKSALFYQVTRNPQNLPNWLSPTSTELPSLQGENPATCVSSGVPALLLHGSFYLHYQAWKPELRFGI